MAISVGALAGKFSPLTPPPSSITRIRTRLSTLSFSSSPPPPEPPESGPDVRNYPSQQFAVLEKEFRRRLLLGLSSSSAVAIVANFAGITSSLLKLSPEAGRSLRLDVVYPIDGFGRCYDPSGGFEFVYPSRWVGDRTLLNRAAARGEANRYLYPDSSSASVILQMKNRDPSSSSSSSVDPVVAFGPPGTKGELNVSVIVTPVPINFSIESFGDAEQVGKQLMNKMTSSRNRDIKATLLNSRAIDDPASDIKYYTLEFEVESSKFHRHNVAVCAAHKGRLFTLNAQTPESDWAERKIQFYTMTNSFRILDV